MNIPGFIKNKYTISVLILLGLLLADVLLHKGMSRVILPDLFTDKISLFNGTPKNNLLPVIDKAWIRAINSIEQLEALPQQTAGFEFDAYFDQDSHSFRVYHDSGKMSLLDAENLLSVYDKRKLASGVWIDLKNLEATNAMDALTEAIRLRKKFGLENKLIIESSKPELLSAFCDSSFYTSYYIPFFNPYKMEETALIEEIKKIQSLLEAYPACSLSGYYFQYPLIRKFFPHYPILTWADEPSISLISYYFNRVLKNDEMVKVVLYPPKP